MQSGGGAGIVLDDSGRLVVGVHAGFSGSPSSGQIVTFVRLPAEPPADSTPPVVLLLTPVDGHTYRTYDPVFADFNCTDDDSGLDACVGTRADGQQVNLTPGANSFSVTATDLAVGSTTTVTSHYDVLDAVSTSIPAGTNASTGSATSATDPLETRVMTPNAGAVTILERPLATPVPGYRLIDWESMVSAPPATAAVPLRLTFWLDATVLGGLDATTVQVLRDGAAVAECAAPPDGTATPDPCVTERTALAGGGVQLGVLTSAASTWTFGELPTPPRRRSPSTSRRTDRRSPSGRW